MELRELLITAIQAALKGGEAILKVYEGDIAVEYKEDNSPLTEADKNANAAITELLNRLDVPVLSEEGRSIPFAERSNWKRLWVVDPLDGTKEFVKRNGEFTVNIALVENGTPILGVIYVPVYDTLYFAAREIGSFKFDKGSISADMDLDELIKGSVALPEQGERPYTMVGSRSHMSPETTAYFEEIKREHPDAQVLSRGSSLKLCMVAEGSADVYPRFAPTMEWDTAAGHAIALQSGFEVVNPESEKPLLYNKEDLLNPWFIVKKPKSLS